MSKSLRKKRNSSVEARSPQTTFLHLNDDCLESIFSHLSPIDLVNVALTSRRFKTASENAFREVFGREIITVCNQSQWISLALNLLKFFGSLITRLRIIFQLENFVPFHNAVVSNCGVKITELRFHYTGDPSVHKYGRVYPKNPSKDGKNENMNQLAVRSSSFCVFF